MDQMINAMLAVDFKIGFWDIVVLIVLSLPPLFVLFSKRVSGRSRFWWFILTSVFSWLAYIPFLLMNRNRSDGEAAPGRHGG
jgi:hypothetical protein